jgi:hypothetical protein
MDDGWGNVKPDRDVTEAFSRMRETLLYLSLGLKYSEYVHFKEIAGSTYFTDDGQHHHPSIKSPLETNDAEYVVTYCIDTIAQIERQVGNIDAPFGKDIFSYY